MIFSKNNKTNKVELAFLLYAIGMTTVMGIFVIYSLIFLSSRMFHAFSSVENKQEDTKFNIEGYNKLGI